MASSDVEFPTWRLAIVLACRLAEPLFMTSISAYAFFMVKDVAPHYSDTQIASFLTVLYGGYSFAQASVNLAWGSASDRFGRRPLFLCGIASVAIGSFGLAFSKTLASIVFFRLVPGFLSGNTVIIRTIIADILKDHKDKSRGFIWNQTVFQIGYILGPLLGGYSIRPCHKIPGLCTPGGGSFLDRYPYALPNLFIGCLSILSFILAYFNVEESLSVNEASKIDVHPQDETSPLLESQDASKKATPTFRQAMTPNVLHLVLNYAIMALHTVCFDQIFPVFLSSSPAESTLPFGLNGGLGLESDVVATFMSSSGIASIAMMMIIFDPIHSRLGSLSCMCMSLLIYPVAYTLLPYLAVLPSSPAWLQLVGVGVILSLKTFSTVFSFNESTILLNTAAPSPNTLGVINGTAQTFASAARGLGPILMGFFIQIGDRIGCSSLGWFFVAFTAAIGTMQMFWLRESEGTDEE